MFSWNASARLVLAWVATLKPELAQPVRVRTVRAAMIKRMSVLLGFQGLAAGFEGGTAGFEGSIESVSSRRRCCRLKSERASLSFSDFKISLGALGISTTGSGNSSGCVNDVFALGGTHALSASDISAVGSKRFEDVHVLTLNLPVVLGQTFEFGLAGLGLVGQFSSVLCLEVSELSLGSLQLDGHRQRDGKGAGRYQCPDPARQEVEQFE